MARTFALLASISTENPRAIKAALQEIVSHGSITPAKGGFLVKTTMRGENARELHRALLSALRQVERRTRLRAEWKSGGIVERYFDYVPKGSRRS